MKLTAFDKEKILQVIKKAKDARIIYRANALNLRAKGFTLIEVADILEISPRTVSNIGTSSTYHVLRAKPGSTILL